MVKRQVLVHTGFFSDSTPESIHDFWIKSMGRAKSSELAVEPTVDSLTHYSPPPSPSLPSPESDHHHTAIPVTPNFTPVTESEDPPWKVNLNF